MRSARAVKVALSAAFVLALSVLHAQPLARPDHKDSVRFAVIGGSGTGEAGQGVIADRLAATRATRPFDIVLMLGDNVYDGQRPRDYVDRFERPYQALLDANVQFYAALGDHDDPAQVFYKRFNMNGRKYYTFTPAGTRVRFFALDTTNLDQDQLAWLEKELAGSQSDWTILFFHHPLYSSSSARDATPLRDRLEPLFVKYGVDVVFSGHDHFYERIKPQKGIQYFVSGAAARLDRGRIRPTALTERGFDQGRHFMLVEVTPTALHFQAISDQGVTVDSGALPRDPAP